MCVCETARFVPLHLLLVPTLVRSATLQNFSPTTHILLTSETSVTAEDEAGGVVARLGGSSSRHVASCA